MSYKFYDAYLAMAQSTSVEYYQQDLQDLIDLEFDDVAPNYTIQYEDNGTFKNIQSIISQVIQPKTGENLGDDYKKLVLRDNSLHFDLGSMFKFDNYYWLVINASNIKSMTTSFIVRKCNYTLKWLNDVGSPIQEPCIVDYFSFTTGSNVNETNYIRTGGKTRYIVLRNNVENYKVLRDRRFILDRISYRVVSTDSITKKGLYQLTCEEHQYNSSTDVIYNDGTGICNIYGNTVYTIEITTPNISMAVNESKTITWTVKYGNTIITDKPCEIFAPNDTFINISDVTNSSAKITSISEGSGTIRISLVGNDDVYAELNYEVISSPSQTISEFIQGADSITNGESSTYSIYKKIDNVVQGDTYIFSIIGTGASLNIIDGNQCVVIANDEYKTITLRAVNNVSGDIFEKTIELTGLW